MGTTDPIPAAKERIWLLEIGMGGRTEHFATRRVDVFNAAGDKRTYQSGLSDPRVSLADESSAEMSVPLIVNEDPEGSSWALLAAQGFEADRQPGTLRRWTPGTELERARTVLTGTFRGVQFDRVGQPLELTLSRAPLDVSRSVPNSEAVVDTNTWPVRTTPVYETDLRIRGSHYCLPLGFPGAADTGASPGLLVEFRLANPDRQLSRMVIADAEVRDMHATTVRLFDYDETDSEPVFIDRPVFYTNDQDGRRVAVIDMSGIPFGTFHFRPGRSYYVSWRNVAGFGGGIVKTDGSGPIRGWADVTKFLIEQFTDLTIDQARWDAEATFLNRFMIDGVISGPTDIWDFIESELMSLVPVRLIEGESGLYFRVMRWTARPEMATARIDTRKSGFELLTWGAKPTENARNRLVLNYAPDRQTGTYKQRRIRNGGGVDDLGRMRRRYCYRCAASTRRFETKGRPGTGVFTLESETDFVEQSATAALILEHKAAELALPARPASFQVPPQWEDTLAIGDVIMVTSPEVEAFDRVALVENMDIGNGDPTVDVLVLEDPARYDRLVP